MEPGDFEQQLFAMFYREVNVVERRGQFAVSLPFEGRDGDCPVIHLARENEGWRLSDSANTLMRLSYENDLTELLSGSRGEHFQRVLRECGVSDHDGELVVAVGVNDLVRGLFRLGRCICRLEDLGLRSRGRDFALSSTPSA